MRKPRDYDAELKALGDRARQLKGRRMQQFGELVLATGADALPVEELAGVLLAAVEAKDAATKEGWRKRGVSFFQRASKDAGGSRPKQRGREADRRGSAPPPGEAGA